jgi:hypothetical protein
VTILDDLPPVSRALVHASMAEKVRKANGRWVLLGTDLSRSLAWHIQTGRYAAFRPVGCYEARVRNTQGSRGDVYVRWIGGR